MKEGRRLGRGQVLCFEGSGSITWKAQLMEPDPALAPTPLHPQAQTKTKQGITKGNLGLVWGGGSTVGVVACFMDSALLSPS